MGKKLDYQINLILDKSINELEQFNKELEQTEKNAKNTGQSADKLSSNIDQTGKKTDKATNDLNNFNRELEDTNKDLKQTAQETQRAGNEINDLGNELQGTSRDASELGSRFENVSNKIGSFFRQTSESGRSQQEFSAHMVNMGRSIMEFGSQVTNMGKKVASVFGGLVEDGLEYQNSLQTTTFLLGRLEQSTQDLIKANSKNALSLGLTERQYTEGATAIATFGKSMGLTGQDVNTFTENLTNLVADMSAFADVPFEDSLGAMKSALVGNYEALGRYGIELSDALINESDYAKKLGKTTQKMTMQEKTMAIMSATMDRGSHIMGFANSEADSMGTSFRILEERTKEVKQAIGDALLPILEPLVSKIKDIVIAVGNWIKENPTLVKILLVIAGVLGALLLILGPLISLVGIITIAFFAFSAGVFSLVLPVLAVIAGIIALGVAITLLIKNFDKIIEGAKNLGKALWELVKGILKGLLGLIGGLAKGLWEGFKWIVSFVWQSMKDVGKNISDGWESIKKWWNDGLENIKNGFKDAWTNIKNVGKNAVDGMKELFSNLGNALKELPSQFFEIGANIIRGLWDGLKSIWSNLTGWFSEGIGGLVNKAKEVLDIGSPSKVFSEIGKNIDLGLEVGLKNNWGDVETAMGEIGNMSSSFMDNYSPAMAPNSAITNNYDYSKTINTYNDNITINSPETDNQSQTDYRYMAEQIQYYKNQYGRGRGIR